MSLDRKVLFGNFACSLFSIFRCSCPLYILGGDVQWSLYPFGSYTSKFFNVYPLPQDMIVKFVRYSEMIKEYRDRTNFIKLKRLFLQIERDTDLKSHFWFNNLLLSTIKK